MFQCLICSIATKNELIRAKSGHHTRHESDLETVSKVIVHENVN